jgi:hypothetical protein
MDQIQLLKKKNDLTRFIQLLDESNFTKLENHLIEANYEVDSVEPEDTLSILSEAIELDQDNSLLTEEVKDKLKVIFTASVNEKVQEQIKGITEKVDTFITENQESVDAYAEYVKQELETLSEEKYEEMEARLDSYLDYVINEWVEENKLGIESGVKTQISDSVLSGLKKLFESNYIDLPDENLNLISELEGKSKNLYESNVELNTKVKTLNKKVSDLNKKLILETASQGLTDLDKDRLVTLSETIKAKTTEDFKSQVNVLKESLVSKTEVSPRDNVSQTQLNEGTKGVATEEVVDPKIQAYLEAISKMGMKRN